MMECKYKYERITFTKGVVTHSEHLALSFSDVFISYGVTSELGFMKLLNLWNARAVSNGENSNNLVYKYIYEGYY